MDELHSRLPEGVTGEASAVPRTEYIAAPHAHTLRMEAEALRSENDALVQQLVSRQMELAGVLEEKVSVCMEGRRQGVGVGVLKCEGVGGRH